MVPPHQLSLPSSPITPPLPLLPWKSSLTSNSNTGTGRAFGGETDTDRYHIVLRSSSGLSPHSVWSGLWIWSCRKESPDKKMQHLPCLSHLVLTESSHLGTQQPAVFFVLGRKVPVSEEAHGAAEMEGRSAVTESLPHLASGSPTSILSY